ncbi:MAG: hypothetical protein WCT12_35145 [Verrucomicrobiota bacterium]
MSPPKELEVQKCAEGNAGNCEHDGLPTLQIENWPATTGKVGVAGIEAINVCRPEGSNTAGSSGLSSGMIFPLATWLP